MIWLWIVIGLFMLLLCLIFWCACVVGSRADVHTERQYQSWLNSHLQNADDCFHEEVKKDADRA